MGYRRLPGKCIDAPHRRPRGDFRPIHSIRLKVHFLMNAGEEKPRRKKQAEFDVL